MKGDMQVISEKARVMRDHNEKLQREHMQKMLTVYKLQREKSNIAKVNEKLKYLHILKQSIPIIGNLLETSNFKVVLELLQSSQDMIKTKLDSLAVVKGYKEKLKEYSQKCKQRMEGECLSLIEQQLKSRI